MLRHILSLFEYRLINMLIFEGVKFLPCLIILYFLRNDLQKEVTTFMMHKHLGMNATYIRNIRTANNSNTFRQNLRVRAIEVLL
jgi:hypothetical protein